MNAAPLHRRRPFRLAFAAVMVAVAGPGISGRAETAAPFTEAASAAEAAGDNAPPAGVAGVVADNVPGNGNPYLAIVARNAFRLKDPLPPPPPPTNAPPPVEPPKIDVKLAGLGEINGVRWAYLMIPDATRQGQFLYPSLTDDPKRGDTRHGGVEVKEIDIKKQFVRVVNGGLEASLNFKDHGVKGAPAAPAGKPGAVPPPGTPGAIQGNRPQTTIVVPAAGNPPAPNAGQHQEEQPVVFSRSRSRASNDTGTTGGGGAVAVPAGGVPTSTTPTVNFPTRPVRSEVANSAAANHPVIPLETQIEVLLNQRKAYEAVGVPLPPIPGLPQVPPQNP